MPYTPIWKRNLGGRVSNPTPTGKLGSTAQHTAISEPRSPAPAKSTSFTTSGKVITTESFTLGSAVSQGQTYPLPTLGDITSITLTLSETSVTGSGSVTLDFANIIDHITIANRNGTIFDNIPIKDPFANGLNPAIDDLIPLFVKPTPTTHRTNQLAASTALSGNLATLTIPGIRCAAEDGPWEFTTYYNAITGFGGTTGGVTALSGTNRIRVGYGDAGGYNTKFSYQTIPTTGTGDYHLETTGIIKNTLINHVILENISAGTAHLAYLDHAVINSHGMNIDSNLSEYEIVQGMTDIYYNAFGALTLVPTAGGAAVNTQFTIGDSDEFILNWGTSASNVQVVYQYLLPSGDAY
jgi:hypothetical protein